MNSLSLYRFFSLIIIVYRKMKKHFYLLFFAVSMSLTACGSEQVINVEQLPAPAREVIEAHFANEQISYVMKERDVFSLEYVVKFATGCKVEFDSKGELKKVDCRMKEVPEALVPAPIQKYVKDKFPNAIITEFDKSDRHIEVELNNDLVLEFNSDYEFLRFDD